MMLLISWPWRLVIFFQVRLKLGPMFLPLVLFSTKNTVNCLSYHLNKNYRFVGIAGLMCVCGLFRFSLCNFLKKFFKCVVISNALNPKVFITNNLERQFPYSSPPLFVSSPFECDALFPFLFEGSRATARRSSLGWCKFSTGPYYHHGILFERGKGLTFYI